MADDLPEMGGGTIAAIVGGILFILGFASTIAIYYMNYLAQLKSREQKRLLQGSNRRSMQSPSSSQGSPMSHQKSIDMMLFDETASRSSTPDFEPLESHHHHHHLASFRIPASPPVGSAQYGGGGQPPTAAHLARSVPAHELGGGAQGSQYFADSDEELLESHARPSAPVSGGSRVHLPSATNRVYFDDM